MKNINNPFIHSRSRTTFTTDFIKIGSFFTALFFLSSSTCFSQTNQTDPTMNPKENSTVYLDQVDPIFSTIKNRAAADLKESSRKSNPASQENKEASSRMKTWPQAKQDQVSEVAHKSITDYTAQIGMDPSLFMMLYPDMQEREIEELQKWNVRVRGIGNNSYVAEFYEDLLESNSEVNAVLYAKKLAQSEYAKRHPESDIGNVEEIKKAYAEERKQISAGKHERYAKVLALLYSMQKDGSIVFIDPFYLLIDFMRN